MSAPMVVTCARCLATYDENDPAVIPVGDDWFCASEPACDDRMAKLLEDVNAI